MKKKTINILFIISLIFYILIILKFILFKYVSPLQLFSSNRLSLRSINLIPFYDLIIGRYIKLDIIGNIILFIPMGIYINILSKNLTIFKNIIKIAVISVFFECSQYIFGLGATDITDIFTNTIGGIIGIGIFALIKKLFKTDSATKTFITICSLIILLLVSGLLIVLTLAN